MAVDTYDLCIIGAGMYGSAAARHASANPSLKVCLIGPNEPTQEEISSREIHSSHYDEGRIVTLTESSRAIQILGKNSIQRYRELEKLSGIQFYNPVGTLLIGERNNSHFLNWIQGIQSTGTPFVDLFHNSIFRKRFPFLRIEDSDHALFDDSGAGHISPRNMVEAEKKVARLQGCKIIEDVVGDVKDSYDGAHEVTTESGNLVKAKRLLFCTGAFTKFKNLAPVENLKMSIHRETAALLKVSTDEAERLSSMPTIVTYRGQIAGMPPTVTGTYILPPIQYPDKHYYLKIGPAGHHRNSEIKTLREVQEWYSHEGDSEVLDILPRILFEMLPGLKVEHIRSMTCITSDSLSGLPYIDRLTPTVTVAVVGNGVGATICEEVGRIAAELSVTGKWDSELPKTIFEAILEDE